MTSILKDKDSLVHEVAERVIMKSCVSECFISHTAPHVYIRNTRVCIVVVVSDEE